MSRTLGLRAAAVCLALPFVAAVGSAQMKVGVISVQRAVLESAEIQKASAALEAKYKPRQQVIFSGRLVTTEQERGVHHYPLYLAGQFSTL